jgi:protein involved in polysaccharide export with SLBB domain
LEKTSDKPSLEDLLTKGRATQPTPAVPMEGAIDPTKYLLGPSDVLSVSLWGIVNFSQTVSVTPEGTLIIPMIGEVQVTGKKLSDAKKTVSDLVRQKFPKGSVTMTLTSPRSFIVTLRGSVLDPGQYVASAVDRVEKIIVEGTREKYPSTTVAVPNASAESFKVPRLKREFPFYELASMRNILLIRRDGDTLKVDIPKYYGTGDDRCNPFLLDGDVIFVPKKNRLNDFVSVLGGVNAPGRFEYVDGDSLMDAIRVAQGFSSLANPSDVIVSRLDDQGENIEESHVDLRQVLEGKKPDLRLHRGDRVLVHEIMNERKDYQILVAGEVNNPGDYPITRGSTKLSKVIKDAGGFTDNALLHGAVVMRKQGKIEGILDPRLDFMRAARSSQFSRADSSFSDLETQIGRNPVVVDFRKLFVEGDTTQDVVVRDADVIYIPSNQYTVLVEGQVASPGYTPHVRGAGLEYYIHKTGGFSEMAIARDARVIKKGTLEWVDPDKTTIEPGDKIWVPKTTISDFRYYYDLFKDVLAVVVAVVTTAFLVRQMSN